MESEWLVSYLCGIIVFKYFSMFQVFLFDQRRHMNTKLLYFIDFDNSKCDCILIKFIMVKINNLLSKEMKLNFWKYANEH